MNLDKCPGCGCATFDLKLTRRGYCSDCEYSGQAAYDIADRRGDYVTARSMEPRTGWIGTHTCETHPTMTCGACARRNGAVRW